MFKIFVAVLLTLSFSPVKAETSGADTTLIKSMVLKAFQLQNNYPDSAYKIATEVYRLSNDARYRKGLAYALMRMGNIKNMQGENDTALVYMKQALNLRKELKDYAGATGACFTLSYIYKETGQIDSAFYIMYEALRLNALAGDSSLQAKIHVKLGHLFLDYKKQEKALPHLQKAELIATNLEDNRALLQVYSAYADYYVRLEKFTQALEFNLKTNSILIKLNDRKSLISNYTNIALCYTRLDEFKLAIFFYQKSLIESLALNAKDEEALIYYNLGHLYNNMNISDSAIFYFTKTLTLATSNKSLGLQLNCYKYLSRVYKSQGNYFLAYQNNLKYSALKDTLLSEEKISSIAEMQTKYETEKKEQQIILLNEQNKTKEAQRKFLLAATGALLLFLIVLGGYYVQRNRIAKKNEQIAQQKMEALLGEQEIKTYNAMIEGQEEERTRIAADLHDRLGSMLSTVKLLFSALDEKIDKNQVENKKQYEKATTLLDEACVEVRRISHNLGTGMVASFGLYRALEELCESIDQSGKISCKMQIYGEQMAELKLNVEIELYRIVQEVFNNTLKYAKAKELNLQLNHQNSSLSVMVEDDGVGFNLSEVRSKRKGMGLNNIKKRAEKVGGRVHIDTKPGRGTTVIIDLPMSIQT